MRPRLILLPVVGVFVAAVGGVLSAHTAGIVVPPSYAGEVAIPANIPTPPLAQRQPFGASITSAQSSHEFSDHLKVEGSNDHVTFVVSTSDPSLAVSPEGVVTIVGTSLAPGTYTVTGTDSNNSHAAGTWSYTLTITGESDSQQHQGNN